MTLRSLPLLAAIVLAASGCGSPAPTTPFQVDSSDLAGHSFPTESTCDGGSHRPALQWSHAPSGTVTFVVVFVDSDAPGAPFTQWLLYDIPPGTFSIAATTVPYGSIEGYNDYGTRRYMGPCPPHGATHHYAFLVTAIDQYVYIAGPVDRYNVEAAIHDHVLGRASFTAAYSRP